MLLRKLYESQSKTQAEIPKQTTPSSPPTNEMSQLQVKMTAPLTAEPSKPFPTGLQSRQAPSPRSPSSPASQSTLKAGQHSPPGSAPSSHSPFTLLGDGEIRQGISGSRWACGQNLITLILIIIIGMIWEPIILWWRVGVTQCSNTWSPLSKLIDFLTKCTCTSVTCSSSIKLIYTFVHVHYCFFSLPLFFSLY